MNEAERRGRTLMAVDWALAVMSDEGDESPDMAADSDKTTMGTWCEIGATQGRTARAVSSGVQASVCRRRVCLPSCV